MATPLQPQPLGAPALRASRVSHRPGEDKCCLNLLGRIQLVENFSSDLPKC